MLSDVKVLEISAPTTMLAGQIFGDLGADVVTVEPPAGAAGRRLPPFVDDRPGLEQSLTWHALNRNKRGVTLDVASDDGRAILEEILPRFDVVIEDVSGGSALDGLTLPPDLIACQISAFSRTGPKARYLATDPVLMAAGGAPSLAGPLDRPPLFFPVPQAIFEAGAEAAVAALGGLIARDRLGGGQIVELQARIATMPAALARLVSAQPGQKGSHRVETPPVGKMPVVPWIYACSDGYASVTVSFAPAFVAMTERITEWLVSEGALAEKIASADLMKLAHRAARGEDCAAPIQRLLDALIATCATKTKQEISDIASAYRFIAAPAMTMADIAAFDHYKARGLFATQHVNGRPVEAPARFAQYSDFQIEIARPAPALSQHTVEILTQQAGLSLEEIKALFAQGIV